MVATSAIYTQIAPPTVETPPFGLFSVAAPQSPAASEWQLGIQWTTDACVQGGYWLDPCITGAEASELAILDCDGRLSAPAKPFAVYAFTKRPIGGQSADVAQAQDDTVLQLSEQRAVEARLWAAINTAVAAPVAAADLPTALGRVEALLRRDYGGLGVIHITPLTATLLGAEHLVRDGNRLTTTIGTPVAVGGGYGPADVATDDGQTIYGTGTVVVLRDVIDRSQVRDLPLNDIYSLAQRTYVVAWDCLAVGATVEAP